MNGDPICSVLGLLLFVTNDIDEPFVCRVLKFADSRVQFFFPMMTPIDIVKKVQYESACKIFAVVRHAVLEFVASPTVSYLFMK